MKELVQAQRYFLISITCMVSHIENDYVKDLVKRNIDLLWSTTEILDNSFNLRAMTFEDIVKHGNEMMALTKMYSQTYDKDKVN